MVENSDNDLLSVKSGPLKRLRKCFITTSNCIYNTENNFGLEELLKDEKIMFLQHSNSDYLIYIKYLLTSDKEIGIAKLAGWGKHLGVKQEDFIIS